MTTVTIVHYGRKRRLGDDKSPMMYLFKPKTGGSKIYSVDSSAQEIEPIESLSVGGASHMMKSFVRAMKKVLMVGNRVKVNRLSVLCTTLTCPGVEQEKDCTMKNITRINLRFKVDSSLCLANDSMTATRSRDSNVVFELYAGKKSVAGESDGGSSGDDGKSDGGKSDGGSGGREAPDPAA